MSTNCKPSPDEIDFANEGISVLHKDVPEEALDHLLSRGHTRASIRRDNFRYLDSRITERLFPQTRKGSLPSADHPYVVLDVKTRACYAAKWAIALPFPDDESYAVVRVEYEIKAAGNDDGPPKFLTPTGRSPIPFVPRVLSDKDLCNSSKRLYIVESPFKACVAADRGLVAIGVNGCYGAHQPNSLLPKNATPVQARATVHSDLHEILLAGREACLLTDRDARTNLNVRKPLINFMDAAEIGFDCKAVYVELPVLENGPGIDDYFATTGNTLKTFATLPRYARGSRVITELRCALMDLTQLGLADRFVALHGEDCRHDPRLGEWFSYTNSGYQSGDVEPHRRMITVVQSLPVEAAAARGTSSIKARAKFQNDCGRNGTINGALELASKDKAVELDAGRFDAEQDFLGTQNGVLRLSDGKLLPWSRELLITKRAGCTFDPKATAPLWGKFIERILDGQRDLVAYAQEIAGACLVGRSARQEVFFLHGTGANGKSVFIETLNRMLGDYAVAVPSKLLLRQQHGSDAERATPFLVKLHGRRLATCSELNENMAVDEAMLKDLTGGDLITGRGLYGTAFQFRNTSRVLIRCNHLPVVTGTDPAIWDRLIIMPFVVTIPETERDGDLATKIAAAELPGVLRWAHLGYRRLAARGFRFDTPKIVRDLTAQHRTNSDVIGTWIEECLELDATKSGPPFRELQTEVTRSYTAFAERNNYSPLSAKNLWSKLRERLGRDPIYRGDGGVAYARGVKIRRNFAADTLIADLERQLAAARAAPKSNSEPTTPPTQSGKLLFLNMKGKKG